MRILLVNDDGINAPGLRTMYKHLKEAGHEIIVVAPDNERSASSHSITLRRDISARQVAENEWSIGGTPVDCMVIALQKIVKEPVDLVVSGINAGQNMGEDVLYSGTIAAAIEAAMLGQRAIALSISAYEDQLFDSAAAWTIKMIEKNIADILASREVLNINFPNLPFEEVKGMRLTNTGHRRYYNFITITEEHEDGFDYRVTGSNPHWDLEPGTDSEAIDKGYISVTPLGFELTKPKSFPRTLSWLENQGMLEF
ncbi:MAG TPA: 5'/3'-nucleotidase SurE [Candidatus Cloacimonetes bacterium]|nr:5'/3'-nucleotidase SurE [Candidatus Cloacimonadota bacterium]